jgi:uncharacterized coiled-coil DUF342 family protein
MQKRIAELEQEINRFRKQTLEMKQALIEVNRRAEAAENNLHNAEKRVKELEKIAVGLCKPEGSKAGDKAYGKWLDYQEQLHTKLGGK